MQNVNEFGIKTFDAKTILSALLLAPAIFWWAALAITLAKVTGLAEYLGNSVIQVTILVVCPLLAVILSLGTSKKTKLSWLIAIAGFSLAAMAFLASFRAS